MDPDDMRIGLILPAAGASRRYAEAAGDAGVAARSKLDEDMGGKPVMRFTAERFVKHPSLMTTLESLVVAGPFDDDAYEAFRLRHGDWLSMLGARVCKGGQTHRYETVRAALAELPETCTHVLIHDAARPCASEKLIARVIEAMASHDAVIPGTPVADTLKRVGEPQEAGGGDPLDAILGGAGKNLGKVRPVEETVDRSSLQAIQTPQGYAMGLLTRAYAQQDLSSTDDAQLVERLGEPVVVVEGEATNLKITRPEDLRIARAVLGVRAPSDRPAHKRF